MKSHGLMEDGGPTCVQPLNRGTPVMLVTAFQANNAAECSLHVRVAGAEHGRKTCGLLLAAAPFAGFLKMPMVAYHLQRPFAVDFLFQSPQGLFY